MDRVLPGSSCLDLNEGKRECEGRLSAAIIADGRLVLRISCRSTEGLRDDKLVVSVACSFEREPDFELDRFSTEEAAEPCLSDSGT